MFDQEAPAASGLRRSDLLWRMRLLCVMPPHASWLWGLVVLLVLVCLAPLELLVRPSLKDRENSSLMSNLVINVAMIAIPSLLGVLPKPQVSPLFSRATVREVVPSA